MRRSWRRSPCGISRSPTRCRTRRSALLARAGSGRTAASARGSGRARASPLVDCPAPTPEGVEHTRPRTAMAGSQAQESRWTWAAHGKIRTEEETTHQEGYVPVVTRRELLEAGVHFGHQTRRWNPKMQRYLFGERSGIYIIDLEKSLEGIEETLRVRPRSRPSPRNDPVHRHEEAGPGGRGRAREPRGHAVREPSVARRDADQLHDHLAPARSACASCGRWSPRARWTTCPRRK